MFGGPNRSPLLPPDFEDRNDTPPQLNPSGNPDIHQDNNNNSDEQNPKEGNPKNSDSNDSDTMGSIIPTYTSWRRAKNSMSKYASGNLGKNGKGKAVSDYVKSSGGSRNAARSAKTAIKTTIQLGNFFSAVSQKGISQVLKDNKIQVEGRKPKEILNDVVNVLAPSPDLNDDSVARKALLITMSILYEKFDNEETDISILDSLDGDISQMLITKYIESYIYEKLIYDVGSRIERKAKDSDEAKKIEKELKDYIESKVSATMKEKTLSVINAESSEINSFVEDLYEQCYKVLEDQL